MRVLGVDPGLTRCGVGVVDGVVGSVRVVASECIRTGSATALERRLLSVADRLEALVAEHRPDVVAVERVLFGINVATAMATGQAAGVALLAAARSGVPVAHYSPSDVKATVAGDGAADKDGLGRMVALQLGLPAAPRPADVADALAVALTHLVRAGAPGRSATARGGTWEERIAANPHLREAGGA